MTRRDRDPISPQVRIVEAAEQLSRARSGLSDDELVDILDATVRDVDALIELLDTQRDEGSRYRSERP